MNFKWTNLVTKIRKLLINCEWENPKKIEYCLSFYYYFRNCMTFTLNSLWGKKEPHNLAYWFTQFKTSSMKVASLENSKGQRIWIRVLLVKVVLLFSLTCCTNIITCWREWRSRNLPRLLLLAKMKWQGFLPEITQHMCVCVCARVQ